MSRSGAFGQGYEPNFVDKAGRWLSTRQARKIFRNHLTETAADIGCGHDAKLGRQLFQGAKALHLVDLAVDGPKSENELIHQGRIPEILGEIQLGTCDAIILNNVLEHLDQPGETLRVLHKRLSPSGILFVNVPTWRGKQLLEFLAFKIRVAPSEEMNDHKMYYDLKDLWPMLVSAGFRPENITCKRHKLGTNIYSVCRKSS